MAEIYCVRIGSLVIGEEKIRKSKNPNEYFKNIYWIDAEQNRSASIKLLTPSQFDEKYLDRLKTRVNKTRGKSMEDNTLTLDNCSVLLKKSLKNWIT